MTGIIVVGVDDTETAQRAAEAARDLAVSLGATLHVVTAFESDRTEVFGSGSDQIIVSGADSAVQVAQRAAESLKTEGLNVSYYAVRGAPASALIQHAEPHDARIIVVGNRRMRGLGRVLGSVANSVAHGAPCDVHIVKTDEG